MLVDHSQTQERMGGAGSGRRILLVEDEPDLATTCVRFLRLIGYAPRTVQSGHEALAGIDVERPDLVLVDLRRPGSLDGPGFLRRLRERAGTIPVILCCTVHGADPAWRLPRENGVVEYLAEPFSLAELRAAVERALVQSTQCGPGTR